MAKETMRLFLREWRKKRELTQEQLAERLETTTATISRIESRKQNWDQAFLEAASLALNVTPADLLIRDPSDPEGLWSIHDQLKPAERIQLVEVAKALQRTGT